MDNENKQNLSPPKTGTSFSKTQAGEAVEWERIKLLGIPIDIIPQEQLKVTIYELLNRKQSGNIVLLSVWDFLRAQRNGEYRNYVLGAALIIPISISLVRGARFLLGKTPVRYMPFNFIVQILTMLEEREYSVYMLGGNAHVLTKAEKNVHQTFPKLRIIGRYPGSFKKQEEDTLLTVIRKSAPSLLLVGRGVHGREKWAAKNTHRLSQALRLWCSDIFEVFAERKKRPSRVIFDRGLEFFGLFLQNPFRIFCIFPFLYYNILLVAEKIKKHD